MVLISQKTINKAMSYVIRNNKRWGRYEMNFQKDTKRLKQLLITHGYKGLTTTKQKDIKLNTITGWAGQQQFDIVASNNTEFLEIVAIIEYYNLWTYFENIFVRL